MTPATIAAGGLAVLALGTGVALGATGVVDLLPDEAMGPLPADLVGYHLCPDEAELGTFVRGDTVLVVGRDEAGEWLQVRSPDDLFERVWVEADLLVPDGDTADVPVASCDASEFVALEPQASQTELTSPSPSPSPTASPTDEPSPTEEPEPTPTPTQTATPTPDPTTPPPSPSPDPSPTAPPSPTPAPNQAPVMTDLEREHATIHMRSPSATVAGCPGKPTSSQVSIMVTDDRGVDTVKMTMSWNQGTVDLQTTKSGSTWTTTVGSYPDGTFVDGTVLTINILATDSDGATSQDSTTITVREC